MLPIKNTYYKIMSQTPKVLNILKEVIIFYFVKNALFFGKKKINP